MTPRMSLDDAQRIVTYLDRVAAHARTHLERTWRITAEHDGTGWPSGGSGGPRSGVSDRVGSEAVRGLVSDHVRLQAALGRLLADAGTLMDLMATATRQPGDLARLAADTEPDCWNHARHRAERHARTEYVVDGNRVCRWCYDQHRWSGEVAWPDKAVIDDHDNGGRRLVLAWRRDHAPTGVIDTATGRVRSVGLAEMHGIGG